MASGFSDVLLANAALALAAALLVWAISLPLRDASIVDLFWGIGFVLIAWVSFAVADGEFGRQMLLAILVTIWGLRLTGYLAWRNVGRGEDFRYVAMRERWGRRFPLVSLGSVFGLQAGLMWLVSLPIQGGQVPRSGGLGVLDFLGLLIWAIGLFFETVGDLQLARFKRDPANAGAVMDRGLWRYTRHPNYFGDFLVWWGLYLIALSTIDAWWTVAGPIVMSILLMRVSGVALLERSIGQRRPSYIEYTRRTSAFFPRPPRA